MLNLLLLLKIYLSKKNVDACLFTLKSIFFFYLFKLKEKNNPTNKKLKIDG